MSNKTIGKNKYNFIATFNRVVGYLFSLNNTYTPSSFLPQEIRLAKSTLSNLSSSTAILFILSLIDGKFTAWARLNNFILAHLQNNFLAPLNRGQEIAGVLTICLYVGQKTITTESLFSNSNCHLIFNKSDAGAT